MVAPTALLNQLCLAARPLVPKWVHFTACCVCEMAVAAFAKFP